jgi:hypothetical protein
LESRGVSVTVSVTDESFPLCVNVTESMWQPKNASAISAMIDVRI